MSPLYGFISHVWRGNAESPTVVNGTSPYTLVLSAAFAEIQQGNVFPKRSQLLRSLESCVDPGAPTAAHKNLLLESINPMLDTEYLFLKLK